MFDYKSKEFTTQKDMNVEKKKLHESLCGHFGLKREEFRLQLGSITLYGLSNGKWLPITNVIGEFNERIKAKSYQSFRLQSRLESKKK